MNNIKVSKTEIIAKIIAGDKQARHACQDCLGDAQDTLARLRIAQPAIE